MKKNKQSFVKSCVIYLTIYSIMLFLTFLIINTIIETNIRNITFGIDRLVKYQRYLDNDEFKKIPIKKYLKNEFVVFDENDKVIFETHNYEDEYILPSEFEFIGDFSSDTYFYVQKIQNNDATQYIITKNTFDEEFYGSIVDYAIIDSEYNIIKGNLFKDKKQLTEKQFMLLKNGFYGKSNVTKYVYTNKNNQKRTLLLYEKNISTREYIKITRKIKSNWFLLIPIILIETIFIIYLFSQKIKNSLLITKNKIFNPLDNNKDSIPIEFNDFYLKITELLTSLDNEKNKRIEEEKVKQSIIADLSHDIKTPLTVIQGYAKAFDDGVVPKDKEKRYMKAIYNKSLMATEIINSLFQYSQMEHCEFKPYFENADFTEFCREYLALKYTDLEIQGYQLNFTLEEREFIYKFDKVLMTRLFDNIINNSVKHNKKGITIYFDYKIENNKIIIRIADNGKGLLIENSNELFDPFIIDNAARTSGVGTGLGLHIAKKIVDLHKGNIIFNKKPIKPRKFEIEIILKEN